MLNLYNRALKKVAVLQNAFDIIETEPINAVGELSFAIPATDKKAAMIEPLFFCRYDGGAYYRIIDDAVDESDVSIRRITAEHAIATLTDKVLFGSFVIGNIGVYTREVIDWLLAKPYTRIWQLGECDFARQFEYAWENENILAALFSTANRFVESYIWKYDFSAFPWRVHLKRIDVTAKPSFYLEAGRNILSSSAKTTSTQLCTRLYGLGYGEGDNQLKINGTTPYIDADTATTYGIVERIFTDRRFEDPASLLERMQALLAELKTPQMQRTFDVADLEEITHAEWDKARVGNVVLLRADNTVTYITKITRNHSVPGDMQIELSTKPTDIVSSIADLADRQRIEQVYAQGATQIYAQSVQANATPTDAAKMNFYIPAEMRIVNAVKLKIQLESFRSYSKSTRGGGGSTNTSSSGGGGSATTTTGGGNYTSTDSGGGKYGSTAAGGAASTTSEPSSITTSNSAIPTITAYTGQNKSGISGTDSYTRIANGHQHGLAPHNHTTTISGGAHSHGMGHTHVVRLPSHSHNISIDAHSHSVSIPAHAHNVNMPSHTHSVSIPEHTHDIEQGIFKFGNPASAGVYVNGTLCATIGRDAEIDITEYLARSGKIARGSWHSVEIKPDALAYITMDMMVQGFIQSRGGGSY